MLAVLFTYLLITGSNNTKIIHPRLVLKGHDDWVHSAAFFPDGQSAVTGSLDGSLRIWDLVNGQELNRILVDGKVLSVAVSPNGNHMVSAGSEGLSVWDSNTTKLVSKLKGHKGAVVFVAFSRDGHFIASGGVDKTIRLWDAVSLKPIGAYLGHTDYVLALAFSNDSKRIYSVSSDNSIRVWSVPSGNTLEVWNGHESSVRWISISDDDQYAITASYDGSARIWDTLLGNEIVSWKPGGEVVTSVAFLPDGRLLTSSRDATPRLWDKPDASSLSAIFRGHTNFIEAMVISPDGRQAISASWDNTAVIWDLPPPKEENKSLNYGE